MLNYYNPNLTEWVYSGSFWASMIWAHFLFILVPGFIAMIVEPPKLRWGRDRLKGDYENVVPIRPRKSEDQDRQKRAA